MLRAQDILYGLPIKEIARICEVDLTTARRWKRGARCPPQSALMVLSRDLGFLDPRWEGWTIRSGELVSPEGWRATTGDVLSIQLTQAQIAAYRDENRLLKEDLAEARLESFEEQPAPTTWEIAAEK